MELVLEHPRYLAFQQKNFYEEDKHEEQLIPSQFKEFLKNFNNENFITEKLLQLNMKELIDCIRYLFHISQEENTLEFTVPYNEQILVSLTT